MKMETLKNINQQILEQYELIAKLELDSTATDEQIDIARLRLRGLLHANSMIREHGGLPSITDD